MNYREYMASDLWKSRREQIILRDGHKCRCCNRQNGLQVHHLNYKANPENDTPEDLVTMCRVHHMNRHGMRVTDAVALGDVLGRLYGPAAVEEARG